MDSKLIKGTCNYPDGQTYEGSWVDGKPEGRGIKTWPDGRKYKGHWYQGRPVGQGTKTYVDGSVKHGDWENGKFVESTEVEVGSDDSSPEKHENDDGDGSDKENKLANDAEESRIADE